MYAHKEQREQFSSCKSDLVNIAIIYCVRKGNIGLVPSSACSLPNIPRLCIRRVDVDDELMALFGDRILFLLILHCR